MFEGATRKDNLRRHMNKVHKVKDAAGQPERDEDQTAYHESLKEQKVLLEQSSFLLAVEKASVPVVKLLLENGANITSRLEDGKTGLHVAAMTGNENLLQQLLSAGADPYAEDNKGFLGLHHAAIVGHCEVVRILAEISKNVDVMGDGFTPLLLAAANGRESVVRLLLEMGADPEKRDAKKRWTALFWAIGRRHEVIARLLIARDDVEINSIDSVKRTPLSWAAYRGQWAVVEELLARNDIEINSKDR